MSDGVVVFTIKYTQCMWIGYSVLLFFPLHERSIERGQLGMLRSRLRVTAGGRLCFGCQRPAPLRIRNRGHPFVNAVFNTKLPIRLQGAKRTRLETLIG